VFFERFTFVADEGVRVPSVREIEIKRHPILIRHRWMAMSHRDIDAFFVNLDRLLPVAVLQICIGKNAIGIALVIGVGKVIFEGPDHVVVTAKLLVFLGQSKHNHRVFGIRSEHLLEYFNTVLHSSIINLIYFLAFRTSLKYTGNSPWADLL